MLAGLPYVVWPIGSLFILSSRKKEDPFLHYHAVQGLLSGAVLGGFSIGLLLFFFLAFRVAPGTASYGGGFFSLGFLMVGVGTALSVLLAAIFLGWRATEGEMIRIPFLGDYAEEKMLDQTGMTRRQFAEMCEAAIRGPEVEEEIPFPDMPDDDFGDEAGVDRLEVARQARAAKTRRDQAMQTAAEEKRMREEQARKAQAEQMRRAREAQARRQQDAQMQQVHQQYQHQRQGNGHHQEARPVPGWPGSAPEPAAQQQQHQPQVKEVDLIGHYKEKAPEGAPNKDVLRQWLHSVDTE